MLRIQRGLKNRVKNLKNNYHDNIIWKKKKREGQRKKIQKKEKRG